MGIDRDQIESFLRQNKFLPYEGWIPLAIAHGEEKKEEYSKIEVVGDLRGLYIYKNENRNKVIYVGKGNPLKYRLRSHYYESFREVSGDTKTKKWHRFFSSPSRCGKLKVYYKELDDKLSQELIEKMLEYVLKPEFLEFE